MNPKAAIANGVTDILNFASQYKSIKRIGIFGSCGVNGHKETNGLNVLYDYDETNADSKDELLEYIEDVDMFVRHIIHVQKTGFISYKDLIDSKNAEFKEFALNTVIWVYTA